MMCGRNRNMVTHMTHRPVDFKGGFEASRCGKVNSRPLIQLGFVRQRAGENTQGTASRRMEEIEMAQRFGRNRRRNLNARLLELENDHDLTLGAVHAIREWAKKGLGFNCTFVDDDMKLIVGLAQRAVLAGLATDAQPDMQRRFREAAEPWRAAHEKTLGRELKY